MLPILNRLGLSLTSAIERDQILRASIFIAFVVLSTPVFLYGLFPILKQLQTALWWAAGLIVLLGLLLATRLVDYSVDSLSNDSIAQERHAVTHWGLLLVCGGIAILVIGYWHVVHLADLRSLPIDSQYADMLPLLLSGFADLDQWRSPYRPHSVPWTWSNFYLPLTFIPYYLAYRCGFDIRYVSLLCFILISLVLLLLWPRTQSLARQTLFFAYWLLTVSAFHAHIDAFQYTRIIHLGPYWLYVTFAFVMLVLQKPRASACGFLGVLAAREAAVFFIMPLGIALVLFQRSTAQTFLTIIPAGLVMMFLPFFIDNPAFYAGNLKAYTSIGWVVKDSGGYHFVGLTGFLNQIGLMEYHWYFLGAGVLICLGLYLARARSWNLGQVLFVCFCCTNISAAFALVPWSYLMVPSLLILGIFVLGQFQYLEQTSQQIVADVGETGR